MDVRDLITKEVTVGKLRKGGEGSGHHGHSGLPNVHGGSRPKGSSMKRDMEASALKLGRRLWSDENSGFMHSPLGQNDISIESPKQRRDRQIRDETIPKEDWKEIDREYGQLDDEETGFVYDPKTKESEYLGSDPISYTKLVNTVDMAEKKGKKVGAYWAGGALTIFKPNKRR